MSVSMIREEQIQPRGPRMRQEEQGQYQDSTWHWNIDPKNNLKFLRGLQSLYPDAVKGNTIMFEKIGFDNISKEQLSTALEYYNTAANAKQKKQATGFLKQLIRQARDQSLKTMNKKVSQIADTVSTELQSAVQESQNVQQLKIVNAVKKNIGRIRNKNSQVKQLLKKQKQIRNDTTIPPQKAIEQMQKIDDQIQEVQQQVAEEYKVTQSQLKEIIAESQLSQRVKRYLTKTQDYLLNNQVLQNVLPVTFQVKDVFGQVRDVQRQRPKLEEFQYPTKKRIKYKYQRPWQWNQLQISPKLHTLPHQAPYFLRKTLQRADDTRLRKIEQNSFFQVQLDPISRQTGMTVAQIVGDQQFWRLRKPPKGFVWDKQQGQLVIMPQNQAVANLWPNGITYKSVPTTQQVQDQLNFLTDSYVTAMKMKDNIDPDIIQMMNGAKVLGFNPHFGAISKNSPALYIGAFVDPMTGSIRLPPKPRLNDYNPVDRNAMLQYKVLKAMYNWNASVQAMQQMRKFMSQTDRGWQATLKNKRKNANVLQRKRKQYRSLAKKIALKQPIYGLYPRDPIYKNMSDVYANPGATTAQIQKATETFMKQVSKQYDTQVQSAIKNFPQSKAPMGAMMRARQSYLWPNKPQIDTGKWLARTLKIAQPLGKTKALIQNQSIYSNMANVQYQRKKGNMNSMRSDAIFNTTQNMRKDKTYDRFNAQSVLHRGSNPNWNALYQQPDPQQAIRKTRRLWGNQFDSRNFIRPYENSSFPQEIRNENRKIYDKRSQAIKKLMGTASLRDDSLPQFLAQHQYTAEQIESVGSLSNLLMSRAPFPYQIVTMLTGLREAQIPKMLLAAWDQSKGQRFQGSAFSNALMQQLSQDAPKMQLRSRQKRPRFQAQLYDDPRRVQARGPVTRARARRQE